MKKKHVILTISLCALLLILNNYVMAQTKKKVPLTKEQIEAFRSAKTVKIVVDQSYKNIENFSLPFKDVAQSLFQYAKLSVVGDDINDYDLNFRVKASGVAVLAGVESYKGAELAGVIYLEVPGIRAYLRNFAWGFSFPRARLKEAPFEPVFAEYIKNLIDIMNDIYGANCIIAVLNNEMWLVRKYAADFLIKIKQPEAVEPLIPILIKDLNDDDSRVRWAAQEALGNLGDSRAVEPLITALNDNDSDVRSGAAEALGKIGGPRAVEPLIAALKDKDRYVQGGAAEALGKIRDPRAVDPLIVALGDEDLWVEDEAREALGKITGQDFGNNQKKWQKWWKKNKKKFLGKK